MLKCTLEDEDVEEFYRVRDVSPKKEMLCVSFWVPMEVLRRKKKVVVEGKEVECGKKRKLDE